MMNAKTAKNTKKSVNMVTVALTVLFIFAFFILINTFGNLNAYGDGEQEFVTITVSAGDTLWSIAERVTPEHRDLRDTISIIRKHNELHSDLLMVGDTLSVPVVY